jgi:hypothetical protein
MVPLWPGVTNLGLRGRPDAVDRFDDGSDQEAGEFYFRLVPNEERRRFWAETAWLHDADDDDVLANPMLFADRGSEAELCREIRLSELWGHCERGCLTMDEFIELSGLISDVTGIRGALCLACAKLDRPNVSANWALANTTLCRGHLRFRLGHAQIEEGGSHRSD